MYKNKNAFIEECVYLEVKNNLRKYLIFFLNLREVFKTKI